jgi:hypothetical protein
MFWVDQTHLVPSGPGRGLRCVLAARVAAGDVYEQNPGPEDSLSQRLLAADECLVVPADPVKETYVGHAAIEAARHLKT